MQIDLVTYPPSKSTITLSWACCWIVPARTVFLFSWWWGFDGSPRGNENGMCGLCSAMIDWLSLSPLKPISVGFVRRSEPNSGWSARGSMYSRPRMCRVEVWILERSLRCCWGQCEASSQSNPRPARELEVFIVLVLVFAIGFVCSYRGRLLIWSRKEMKGIRDLPGTKTRLYAATTHRSMLSTRICPERREVLKQTRLKKYSHIRGIPCSSDQRLYSSKVVQSDETQIGNKVRACMIMYQALFCVTVKRKADFRISFIFHEFPLRIRH